MWGKARVNQFKTESEVIEYARSISPTFGNEVDAFFRNQIASASEANKTRVKSSTLSFPRWLNSAGSVASPVIKLLSEHGIIGLAENDRLGFKYLYKHYQEETQNNQQFLLLLNAALDLTISQLARK